MNLISDKQIMDLLKEDYEYLKSIYNQDRILGVFTYGKVNYGFAENISDIKVKMYYLPYLEEICTSINLKNEDIEYNGHMINIKDIRLILDNVLTQEGTTMECFFSEYNIITPKFKKVFNDIIIERREEVFKCNPAKRVTHSVERAYENLAMYKETGDKEYLFDACRRRLGTSLYLKGEPVINCIKLTKDYHVNYLWGVKQGLFMPDIDEVTNDLKEMQKKAEVLETHPEMEDLVKTTIVEIMKIALTKTISAEEFLNKLTSMEKIALKVIMQYLNQGEGIVSISQLTEGSSISRPVFKSVLQKLKDMEIAEVTNMGVKGTYVKIIDGVFLNIDDFID